jgi:hypothetical protein
MQRKALLCAALWLHLFSTLSLAGDKLTGNELRNLFPGHFRAVVSGLITFRITIRRDGSLSAISPRGKKDQGRWSVNAGKLCIKFDNWLGARVRCTAIAQDAGWYIGSGVKFKRG